jgi:predicted N-acetyltransferase YhbS
MKIIIRSEVEEDYEEITKVHDRAFNQTNEGKIVENLRKTPSYISELSLVAEYEKKIVGHIFFYPIKINTDKRKCDSLALAPMSVHPDYQNKGIGSKLVEKGLTTAKKLGFKSAIVLGHSKYYPRFGFKRASKWGICAPFDVPDDVFLAIELERNGLHNCSGTVDYPKEFSEV